MNELIKQLAERAGAIGYDDDGNELTPVLVGKDLEKFAELIVKECIDTARNAKSLEAAVMIKQHFGVEE